MGRDAYDDMMPPSRGGRRVGGAKIGLIVCIGFLVCLIGFIVFMILKPVDGPSVKPIEAQSVKTVEVKGEPIQSVAPTQTVEAVETEPQVVSVAPTVAPTVAPVVTKATTQAIDISDVRSELTGDRVRFDTHVVKSGEDLSSIAAMYGLKVQTIISVNRIRNISSVVEGVSLQIPDRDGQYYTVQSGDMLSTIARKYNLGWKKLQEVNGLKSETIRVGEELFIPDSSDKKSASAITAATISFIKPVSGSVIGSFGQFVDGKNLDIILIAGPAGSAVSASAKGAVIDAGRNDEIGRFIVIQHEEGYKTTYGYLERVNVKAGSEVEQGDVIGTIGTSAESYGMKDPTLSFKIEQSGIALDPLMFF